MMQQSPPSKLHILMLFSTSQWSLPIASGFGQQSDPSYEQASLNFESWQWPSLIKELFWHFDPGLTSLKLYRLDNKGCREIVYHAIWKQENLTWSKLSMNSAKGFRTCTYSSNNFTLFISMVQQMPSKDDLILNKSEQLRCIPLILQ